MCLHGRPQWIIVTHDTADGRGDVSASYTAIADVSEALLGELRSALTDRADVFNVPESAVELVSPAAAGSEADVRIGLSLYGVTENAAMKNADRTRIDETRYSEPPLALGLQYLLTAYPASRGTAETVGRLDQQRLLGFAMQVLNDVGSLGDTLQSQSENAPQVSVASASADRLTALWNRYQGVAYQPSVAYHVGPVVIPSRRETVVPQVTDRRTDLDRREE